MENIKKQKIQKHKTNKSKAKALRLDSCLVERIESEIARLNKGKIGSNKITHSAFIKLCIEATPWEKKEKLKLQTVNGGDLKKAALKKCRDKFGNCSENDFFMKLYQGEINLKEILEGEAVAYI